MPRSLPDTGAPKRRLRFPPGMPQIAALMLVLLVDGLVADHFFQIVLQDGRLFGSPIDILNRAAPVALLAIGMTLVIATGGIDLSVGAVMAIAGATAATLTVGGHSLAVVILASLGVGVLAGLWNGILVAVLKIQPFVATLILMVAGRGVAQLITSGQIVTFNSPSLAWLGSGSLFFFPTPVIIAILTLLAFWLFTRKTALGMFIEAVGINIRAAKNAGVSTRLIVMLTYMLSGLCAAIAGIIVAADIRGAARRGAGARPRAHAEIIRLIETLCADGLALLVISSELEELVGYADRVIILRDRQQVAEIPLEDLSVGAIMNAIAA
ncbi:Putative sugar ABC transport system, permease protein YtfT [Cronobacter malonaticus 507]|nr:Putative sugar ABC transport system, permease protein YtfT [Cronobacter malonaticus 507]